MQKAIVSNLNLSVLCLGACMGAEIGAHACTHCLGADPACMAATESKESLSGHQPWKLIRRKPVSVNFL